MRSATRTRSGSPAASSIVTPGLTIKDRLRVLQPNDPDSYYDHRELVPTDMLRDLGKAKIVITNYHSFKLRETMQLASGTRALLKGRGGEDLQTLETEGQMLQRVMPELMGMKNVMVLNDEAHHCYREKPGEDEEEDLKGDDRKEAEKNKEAARLWIMIGRIPKPHWARPKIAQKNRMTKDMDTGQNDLANVQSKSKSSKSKERRMKRELRPRSLARPAPPSAPEGRQRVAGGKRSAAPGKRSNLLTTRAPAGATHLEITVCDLKIVAAADGRARLLPSRPQQGPSAINSQAFVPFPIHIPVDMHRKAPFSIHVRRNMYRKVRFSIHVHPRGGRS